MPYTNPVEISTLKTEIEKFKAITDEAAISPVVLGNLLYQLASHINKAAAAFGVPPNIPYAETLGCDAEARALKLHYHYRQPDGYDGFQAVFLPEATTEHAGVMSADDKRSLRLAENLCQNMDLGENEAFRWAEDLRDWFNALDGKAMTADDKDRLDNIYGSVMSCATPIDEIIYPGYYKLTNGVILAVSKSANETVNPTTARWTVTQTMFAHDGIVTRSAEVVKSGRDITAGAWSQWKNLLDEIPLASSSENGLMSAYDKTKLDSTFNSVIKCMDSIDTITEPGFYRTQYGEVLVVSKSPANGNQEETRWTVTQNLFDFDGIKTRNVEIVRRNLTVSKGLWSEWLNQSDEIAALNAEITKIKEGLKKFGFYID